MKIRDFELMEILAPIELDGNRKTIVLNPRNDGTPKGRFNAQKGYSQGSTGWQGSDKVMDSEGNKYQVNFQIVRVDSKVKE